MGNKNIYIIAGSNGSGKTTFAKKFLPDYVKCKNFINADLIAQGLSPFSPQVAAMKAGRLVLEQIQDFVRKNVDFAFETTLAGRSYIRLLKDIKTKKYYLHLFYLWIPTPELAIGRIKDRIASGGHDVPAQDVKRRFYRGTYNLFKYYKPLLNSWLLFDNSDSVPRLIAEEKDGEITVRNKELFENILKEV